MSPAANPTDPAVLLAHASWLRGLARHLVADPSAVDDVVQDTWLVALSRPPRIRSSVRGWLAAALRSVAMSRARSDRRRERREARAAPPRGQPDPADLIERIELHYRLVAHVRELEEPYRRTILLRFFEAMRPHEIALREGIPSSTVRSRLQRGIEILRGRLDSDYRGDRGAWSLALLPLARLEAPAAATIVTGVKGGLLVSAKVKLAGVVAVLVLFALLTWRFVGTPAGVRDGATADRTSRTDNSAENSAEETDATPNPAARAVAGADQAETPVPRSGAVDPARAAARATTPAPETSLPAGTVIGRVALAKDDGPVAAEVSIHLLREGRDVPPVRRVLPVDETGRFRFDGLPPGTYYLSAGQPGYAQDVVRVELTDERGVGPCELRLERCGTLRVTVRDASGAPMAGQRIMLSNWAHPKAFTDADGQCVLSDLPPGMAFSVMWSGEGFRVTRTAHVTPGGTTDLVFRTGATVLGTVTGPDGAPQTKAVVYIRPSRLTLGEGYRAHTARTDEHGDYLVGGIPAGEYAISVQVIATRSYVLTVGRLTLRTGDRIDHPIRIAPTELSGRVTRASDGRPLPRKWLGVFVTPVELDGGTIVSRDNRHAHRAWVDEEGRFRIAGIPPGPYELSVIPSDKRLRPVARLVVVPPGGRLSDVSLVLAGREMGKVRVRVLEPDGGPARGVVIAPVIRDLAGKRLSPSHYLRPRHPSAGVYELELEAGRYELTVDRFGSVSVPETFTVTIESGGLAEQTVRLKHLGDALLTVLDPSGAPVGEVSVRVTRAGEAPREMKGDPKGEGRFLIRLVEGEVTLRAVTATHTSDPVTVTISADLPARPTFRLRPRDR